MSDTYTINSGTITLTGTASWADNAVSASYAPSNNVGGINGMAYFTASTTWNVPAGISNVRVIAIGAGGGGGSHAGTQEGSGGGGGGYAEGVVSVSGTSSINIIVGLGGSPGKVGDSGFPGLSGGSSSFLSVISDGGSGGATGNSSNPGAGGIGISGNILGDGTYGNTTLGGYPGNVPWMFGPTIPGSSSPSKGVGGAGGVGNNNSGQTGSNGCVIIYF